MLPYAARIISLTTLHTIHPNPPNNKKTHTTVIRPPWNRNTMTPAALWPLVSWLDVDVVMGSSGNGRLEATTAHLSSDFHWRAEMTVPFSVSWKGWTVDKKTGGKRLSLLKELWLVKPNNSIQAKQRSQQFRTSVRCTRPHSATCTKPPPSPTNIPFKPPSTFAPWQLLRKGIVCVAWNPTKKVRNHCTRPSPWHQGQVVGRWRDGWIQSLS